MSSIKNTVHYCCISKGNRVLYAYNGGDSEIDKLATLCLEKTPMFHSWYFHTNRKQTFGFFMEDGYVYFVIVDEGLGSPGVLQFLEHLRNDFKKAAKSTRSGSKGSFSGVSNICLQEQLVPVIGKLISSLENVSKPSGDWKAEISPLPHSGAFSTKAPLLGKPGKQEKKKKRKERAVEISSSSEDHRRSTTDREIRIDVAPIPEQVNQVSLVQSSVRIRPPRKMCRIVQVVLVVDMVVCAILFEVKLISPKNSDPLADSTLTRQRHKLVNAEERMKSLEANNSEWHKKLVNSEERKKTLEVDNNEWEIWRQALKKALASEGMGDMGDPTFKELFEQNERFFTIAQQGPKGDYEEDFVSTAVTLENVVIARREKMAKKKKMQEFLFQPWTKYLVDVRSVEIGDNNFGFKITVMHQEGLKSHALTNKYVFDYY
ncbi:hypothetical protein GIB67_001732 [Kingdonia uniflora]|uniref:Longin domain-containing protein n=1 Tax=Kingdonia uniflora TaxID=39325 RepID=A0A7J7LN12_9MAGN|nr:hypothetical protein GIB67_001732 [Kingdonia uniflora]